MCFNKQNVLIILCRGVFSYTQSDNWNKIDNNATVEIMKVIKAEYHDRAISMVTLKTLLMPIFI